MADPYHIGPKLSRHYNLSFLASFADASCTLRQAGTWSLGQKGIERRFVARLPPGGGLAFIEMFIAMVTAR
jgi:hypothetical protein